MKVTITTGAVDERMAKPADLVTLNSAITTALARDYLDTASAIVEGRDGVRYPPWRQSYTLRLRGSDSPDLLLYSKPIETATITDLDGNTVATTDYTIIGNGSGILDRLERSAGWVKLFSGTIGLSKTPDPDSERDAWIATTTAGWLMPGQIADWAASITHKAVTATTSRVDPATGNTYLKTSWVRSTDPRTILRFECTTAGTTAASEPAGFTASATVAGTTITDNTVTWTARDALELPADLSEAVLRLALWKYETRDQSREVIEQQTGDSLERTEWATEAQLTGQIPAHVRRTLEAYR